MKALALLLKLAQRWLALLITVQINQTGRYQRFQMDWLEQTFAALQKTATHPQNVGPLAN